MIIEFLDSFVTDSVSVRLSVSVTNEFRLRVRVTVMISPFIH